jgi:hypothetical protein
MDMHRLKWIALAVAAALVAVAAAGAIGNGSGAERVSATFSAASIGDPNDRTCAVTPEDTYGKFAADYSGRLVTDRDEVLELQFIGDKIIFSHRTGLGTVKGKFNLVEPDTRTIIGSGELNAVFIGDINSFEDPNEFRGELHGMLVGGIEDPNERTIIWLFSASLTDGGRTLSGFIGDRNLMPAAAILFPPDPCRR